MEKINTDYKPENNSLLIINHTGTRMVKDGED